VINVQVPYEGDLEGYRRVHPYSAIAGDALAADGYTNLYDVDGGIDAWQESGRALLHRREPTSCQ
jgi:hypothetical protein